MLECICTVRSLQLSVQTKWHQHHVEQVHTHVSIEMYTGQSCTEICFCSKTFRNSCTWLRGTSHQ